MKNIKGFKALRYDPSKNDISECIAPPYDVFDYGDPADLKLRENPANIVHIQKPEGEGDTRYENARKKLASLMERGILMREERESFYILEQSWNGNSRTGIISAVKLDETYTRIKRHEKTKSAPVKDRLNLTKSTGTNIGCIFLFFSDSDGAAMKAISDACSEENSIYSFEFPGGIKNNVYRTGGGPIADILEKKIFYIADGHHRYQTMIDYRDIMRSGSKASPENASYEYAMMFLVPHSQLKILGYHRLIRNIPARVISELPQKLEKDFIVEKSSEADYPSKGTITMYTGSGCFMLKAREPAGMLDTQILQDLIMEPLLYLDQDKIRTGDFVRYAAGESSVGELTGPVDDENFQAAFILSPTTLNEIMEISDKGSTMPPKSTYFYPKVPSGIVLYKTD